jgi:hypothetical protein
MATTDGGHRQGVGVGYVGQGLAQRGAAQRLPQRRARQSAQFKQEKGVVIQLSGQAVVDPDDMLAGVGGVGTGATGCPEIRALARQ